MHNTPVVAPVSGALPLHRVAHLQRRRPRLVETLKDGLEPIDPVVH